jgi:hypothetical protein
MFFLQTVINQEGVIEMNNTHTSRKGYALALVLGALAGGLLVVIATKALPKMMSGMMQNMMLEMKKNGFKPGET